ncbi:protein-disulfide reductase DsbD domain-containing protein [Providencia huaxiensis]|uniref:Thioredoxin family protein n=1 Tax=Providencia huaxiensis TaxID=2027290 RepID=A0ABU2J053_9GAMM|nr:MULTISPECIES: protein-disulfide reductase DsbD domain-containing protein [Providencia]MBZ3681296.1 thioredoxin family protein [Providencia rettgeri]MBN6361896.1 thioredoxin family protein [Providencia huaxiensis]MCD2529026.1 thioredoxin family protein [Providencia huaxiensis]MCG9534823.1 thioredoxin family protein [Providencia huaxiensis]MDT0134702.1 thioredoxin family protein [Providencia huaxiensis]
MRFLINSFFIFFALFSSSLYAADTGWLQPANTGWMNDNTPRHAQVRLLSSAQENGKVDILLDVKLDEGWKTYWRSPGEGGVAPEIVWSSPVEATDWQWPTPGRFDVAGVSTQGYMGDIAFPITVTSHEKLDKLEGTLTLSTCSNVCILTDYPFELDLTEPVPADFTWAFNQAKGAVPPSSGLVEQTKVGFANDKLIIELQKSTGNAWEQPNIFTDVVEGAALGVPVIETSGDHLTATIDVGDDWGGDSPDLTGKTLSFVVADGDISQQVSHQVSPFTGTIASKVSSASLWQVMLFALLGGLILNLMPCVLPVLAMKLGSVLMVPNGEQKTIRRQFLLSSLGILVSFWLLALLMTLLRVGQQAVGWGIQFQNPWFIGFMVLVTALFTANLFGLFEINLGSKANTRLATAGGHGNSGHFWQGVFATLLATPCSAPFLGTAVAFALAAPMEELWLIFTALGVGMSLPWLLIAAFPVISRLLPKPGMWMLKLRAVLGLMMLVSSLWLISLLIPHFGVTTSTVIAVVFLVLLVVFIAIKRGVRAAILPFILFAAFAGGFVWMTQEQHSGSRSLVKDTVNWQPLTEQAITAALADNKRVFIDVTAEWCVTCKANKYNVLLRDDIQQLLSEPDVVALRGDWTKPSPEITAFLQKRGQVAVPFNQIYGPNLAEGEVLSTILDRESLISVMNQAKGATK